MGVHHDKRFPGESDAYRQARDDLLAAELELKRQVEAVAALRRGLPLGGAVSQDYLFTGGPSGETRLSQLFAAGKDSLVIYNFMYAPGDDAPCPMCTSMLDSLNASAPHIQQRVNLAVVAKAPAETLAAWAAARGWDNLLLLSSGGNSFNLDYFGEGGEGNQLPMLNVFQRQDGIIYHSYGTEALYAPAEPGQHFRHVDMIWPLWNVFDLTKAGRGDDWFPALSYD
ncbi:MAG: DUF899 family protein [Alphaproteobacteria bacterium]|jgi:predicted dithiol-disulfide oxidoreductase (DUF899 family)|nr:DUF899 family protein [Alphaproteobacteria bacterium]MDP6830828.1 DUF899 family protein [Alphaproteobacteria bacterium]MDP6872661.1 DUF899 family protein [Alphaproteobacteria bacterium]